MRRFFTSLMLFLAISTSTLVVVESAFAQTLFETATGILQETELPDFAGGLHESASIEEGADSITSALFLAMDFLKYIVGSIAVIYLIILGLRLVSAGGTVDDQSQKVQETIKYIIIGLLIIILADELVTRVLFGSSGEFLASEESAKLFAKQGGDLVLGVVRFIESLIGVTAILMIVVSAFRMISDPENEDQVTKAKRHVMWAAIGLMLIGISELTVQIFFGEGGDGIDVAAGSRLLGNITQFVASFIATAGVIAFVYGGYLYITDFGNDEGTANAKKVMTYAIVGLLLAAAAFAIVTTLINLEGRPDEVAYFVGQLLN